MVGGELFYDGPLLPLGRSGLRSTRPVAAAKPMERQTRTTYRDSTLQASRDSARHLELQRPEGR